MCYFFLWLFAISSYGSSLFLHPVLCNLIVWSSAISSFDRLLIFRSSFSFLSYIMFLCYFFFFVYVMSLLLFLFWLSLLNLLAPCSALRWFCFTSSGRPTLVYSAV